MTAQDIQQVSVQQFNRVMPLSLPQTGGDHLVGWANSSIRFLHQLPALPAQHTRARGVVLEEPFSAAWDLESSPQIGPDVPISVDDIPIER